MYNTCTEFYFIFNKRIYLSFLADIYIFFFDKLADTISNFEKPNLSQAEFEFHIDKIGEVYTCIQKRRTSLSSLIPCTQNRYK